MESKILSALWKKGWARFFSLVILSFIGNGGFQCCSTRNEKETENNNAVIDSEVKDSVSLSVPGKEPGNRKERENPQSINFKLFENVEEFKEQFNVALPKSDFKIDRITIHEEEGKVFEYRFNNDLVIIGKINTHDDSIMEIGIIRVGYSFESCTNMVILMVQVIAAIDSSLSPDKRFEIIKEIGYKVNAFNNGLTGVTFRNGVRYGWAELEDGATFIAGEPQ
ncbi:MAG TPA: hypothetical protein VKQ08_06575 [Cyclobacteriaceae bacterium]|nr:hypothetical protein [Cyclobacteriaceae bacterium]